LGAWKETAVRTLLKVACGAYVLALIGTTVAFFVQQHVTYHDHIDADRRSADEPVRAVVVPVVRSDASPSDIKGEVDIRFINTRPLTAHASMGNEIEEHLLSLFWMNIASAAVVCLLCVATLKGGAAPNQRVQSDAASRNDGRGDG
jgi:hypothetical protein